MEGQHLGRDTMNAQSAQIIALNITLIAVSLLATTLIVLVPTWKRFSDCWSRASIESRRTIFKGSIVPVMIPLVLVMSGLISLLISTEAWHLAMPNVAFLVILSLILPAGLYMIYTITWKKLRGTKDVTKKGQPDLSKEIGVASALVCFLFTIFLTSTIAISAIPLAVDVAIGGYPQEDDFEYARAMIITTPFMIYAGLIFLGASYWAELYEMGKGANADQSESSSKESRNPEVTNHYGD